MTTESQSTTSEAHADQAGQTTTAPPAAKPETAAEKKKREAAYRAASGPVGPSEARPPAGLQANPLAGLTEGRVVHYLMPSPNDPSVLWHRPGIVTRVVSAKSGKIDLTVFIARSDYPKNLTPGAALMIENATFDPTASAEGTWHFPERA